MQWKLLDRGFLPTPDPLSGFSHDRFAHIEMLGRELPQLVHDRRFREAAAQALRDGVDWSRLADRNGAEAERLFMLFSYIASAYVHSPGLPPVDRLPTAIAGPLVRLGEICQRPPILAYASYCLHNWRRIDPAGPIALGNIELLQNFSVAGDGKKDEDWFILVHVDIEARAGAVLTACRSLAGTMAGGDDVRVDAVLQNLLMGLRAINKTMDRMPEGCSPEVYFRKVRPYIFGFNDLVYEGCFDNKPQTYRGETGAQSSIVPTLLMALGIRHKDSMLMEHLNDMRNYMPAAHRQFIAEQASVREHVLGQIRSGAEAAAPLKEMYNACLAEVIAFRSRHFEYAINYIQKKVANPLATGGTPYVPWLRQLIEESKEHYL